MSLFPVFIYIYIHIYTHSSAQSENFQGWGEPGGLASMGRTEWDMIQAILAAAAAHIYTHTHAQIYMYKIYSISIPAKFIIKCFNTRYRGWAQDKE